MDSLFLNCLSSKLLRLWKRKRNSNGWRELRMSELIDTYLEYKRKIDEWSTSKSVHPLLRIISRIIKSEALRELDGDVP